MRIPKLSSWQQIRTLAPKLGSAAEAERTSVRVNWKKISAIKKFSSICVVTLSCACQAIVSVVGFFYFIFLINKKCKCLWLKLSSNIMLKIFAFNKLFVSRLILARFGVFGSTGGRSTVYSFYL